MRRKILKIMAVLTGSALIAVAVFAVQLGIDNNPAWGPRRYGLLAAGLLALAWTTWDRVQPRVLAAANSLENRVRASVKLPDKPRAFPFAKALNPTALLALLLPTILIYLWIFTAGTLTEWPRGSRYFYLLAEGFAAGKMHLLEEPSPQLLAAENPYFYKDRGEIPVIWDALFYEEKYYLYWGPVPGLIVAALQPFSEKMIRDPALLFTFMAGTLGMSALLLRALWQRFTWLPKGMFFAGLVALALNAPLTWLLTRGKVYEAAISGGQFFLIGGLYLAFTALSREDVSPGRLFLAGVFWALAADTRVNLALSVTFLGILVIGRIFSLKKWAVRPAIAASLAFGIPLVLGAAGLMTYNTARFGAPLDFGYRYLITGPTIPEDPSRVSSPDYIFPNFYQYVMRPPVVQAEFPYVVIPWIKNDMWPFFVDLPPDYFYTEPVASLFLTVPILGLALLAALRWGWLHLNGAAPPSPSIPEGDRALLRWLGWALGGAAFLAFAVLLFFVQNTYRYIVDLTLTALFLALIFLPYFRLQFKDHPWERRLWTLGWQIAAVLTPVIAVLTAITGYERAFEKGNPDLYFRLLDWFP